MELTTSDRDVVTRFPRALLYATIAVSLLPLLLGLMGVDFGSPNSELNPGQVFATPSELSESLHRVLSGSFTHTILECGAVSAAAFTGLLALVAFRLTGDSATPIIAAALVWAGAMDAFHTLAADRLIPDVTDQTDLIPFTWAVCRTFHALIVTVGIGLVWTRIHFQINVLDRVWMVSAVSLGFGVLAYGVIRYCARSDDLPRTMFPDAWMTRPGDAIALVLFLINGLLLWNLYRWIGGAFAAALLISTIPNVATQLHMAFGSAALFDHDFNIAHFLKIVAYMVPVMGLVIDYAATYRRQQSTVRKLETEVTQKRTAQEALQASEQRFALAVKGSQDGLWDWDLISGEVWYSPQWKRQIGYEDEELENTYQAWESLLHPEDKQPVLDALNQHLENDQPYDVQFRLRAKAGSYRWIRARGVAQRDTQGKPVRMAGSHQDVTHLKQSQERFRQVIEASLNALVMVDQQGRIRLVNGQTESWFGYHRVELIGQPIEALVPQRLRDGHRGDVSTYLQNPETRTMGAGRELFGQRKDGSEFPVEIGLRPVETEHGDMVLATIADITRRKEIEDAIRAKNRDLETLLYVTSHDLREPLRTIQNFSRLVTDRYGSQLDEKGRDFLRRINRGGARLDTLIDDITTLSRAQRAEVVMNPVDAKAVVEDILDRLADRIEQTQATIRVDDQLPLLHGDRRWITQAIYNLVLNALKFTCEDESPDIEIRGYRPPDKQPLVGLCVCDRGPGVELEQIKRIFKLFQRAVGREVEGTGAGLAIVRQIALRHGGRVWVQARQGGGSEFVITFRSMVTPLESQA